MSDHRDDRGPGETNGTTPERPHETGAEVEDFEVARLLKEARSDVPPDGLEQRVLDAVAQRGTASDAAASAAASGSRGPVDSPGGRRAESARPSRRVVWGSALAVAAGASLVVGWYWGRSTAPEVRVVAEGPSDGVSEARHGTPDSTPAFRGVESFDGRAAGPPCAHPVVAVGDEPLVDDFETPDAAGPRLDGREGEWLYITDLDQDDLDADFAKVPTLLPEAERVAGNQRALFVDEGLLRDWGATVEYLLEPGLCYDASAYAGLRFRARGDGVRVQVSPRQVDYIPVEYGGLCEEGCFISHRTPVRLTEEWQTFELTWDQFRRRGYDSPPLDPARLHTLQFQVESEDTPFELWLDDVEFLPSEEAAALVE